MKKKRRSEEGTRIINGKKYIDSGYRASKYDAKNTAKMTRSFGIGAIVIKKNKTYAVYTTDPRKVKFK